MSTEYMITTNGVDFGTRYTSKARAISEAETIGKAAAERAHGDVVTVQTIKTSKVVWTETYYTHNDGLKFSPVVEITGDVDVPASITTADGPAESDDVPFEDRHAAYVESLKSDPEVMAMYASEAAQTSATGYVGIMQTTPGFNAEEHIHAVGCRDITREMRKFGQSEGDTFPYPADFTVWNIINTNDGGRAADRYTEGTLEHAQEMIFNASAELQFMPCAASLPLGVTPFGPLIDAGGQYMISEETSNPVTPELVDNMSDPLIVEALLSVEVNGATVSLGWHTITVPVGTEKSTATLYAEQSGSTWHKGGTPEWDSIITVVESYV